MSGVNQAARSYRTTGSQCGLRAPYHLCIALCTTDDNHGENEEDLDDYERMIGLLVTYIE